MLAGILGFIASTKSLGERVGMGTISVRSSLDVCSAILCVVGISVVGIKVDSFVVCLCFIVCLIVDGLYVVVVVPSKIVFVVLFGIESFLFDCNLSDLDFPEPSLVFSVDGNSAPVGEVDDAIFGVPSFDVAAE